MDKIWDILLDSVIDSLRLLPFLFLAFLIIEFIEHKCGEKSKKIISDSGRFGPILGGLLGGIPQCGFSVLATNLYVTRIITMGTLIAIYLATSDEMIAIFLSNQVPISTILLIVGMKVVIGIACGLIIDLVIRKKKKKMDISMCDDCDCEHSLLKASLIHTFKILGSIFIIILILNIMFAYLNEDIIDTIFMKTSIFSPFVSALIGLIPNCGSSVLISELYINGVINFGSLMAGLLANSGVGILVLFRTNKNIKENISIILLLYVISVIIGILFLLTGVKI